MRKPKKARALTLQHMGIDCHVVLNRYTQGNALALELVAANTANNVEQEVQAGEHVCRVSINMKATLGKNEICVKTYGECDGILAVLTTHNIVSPVNNKTVSAETPIVTVNIEQANKFSLQNVDSI